MDLPNSTDRSADLGLLPTTQEVTTKLAEIAIREEVREQIAQHLQEGKWDEALKAAQEASLSIADDPVFLQKFTVYLDSEKKIVAENLLGIQNSLKQAQDDLRETKKALREQEMLAAGFRADEALEKLDLRGLREAIGVLEDLQKSAVAESVKIVKAKLKEKLTSWPEAFPQWFKSNVQTLEPSNLTEDTLATQIRIITVNNSSGTPMDSLRDLPLEAQEWVEALKGEFNQTVPNWLKRRLDALKNDHNWLQEKERKVLSLVTPARSDPQKWLELTKDRPTNESRIAILRQQKLQTDKLGFTNDTYLKQFSGMAQNLQIGKIDDLRKSVGGLAEQIEKDTNLDTFQKLIYQDWIRLWHLYVQKYEDAEKFLQDGWSSLETIRQQLEKSQIDGQRKSNLEVIRSHHQTLKKKFHNLPQPIRDAMSSNDMVTIETQFKSLMHDLVQEYKHLANTRPVAADNENLEIQKGRLLSRFRLSKNRDSKEHAQQSDSREEVSKQ